MQEKRDQRDEGQERECLEIDLEGFGKRVMPETCKALGQCGQEEGAEREGAPGDPSRLTPGDPSVVGWG